MNVDMTDCQTPTLEVRPNTPIIVWYGAVFLSPSLALALCSLYAVFLQTVLRTHVELWELFPQWAGLTLLFLVLTIRHNEQITLVASTPPRVEVRHSWFGRWILITSKPLTDVAWVGIRRGYDNTGTIHIEAGTRDYQTTSIVGLPEDVDSINQALSLCSQIAAFLQIQDRGFPERKYG